jgi:TctA family transporter
MMAEGNYATFVTKPISLALLIMAVLSLSSPFLIKKVAKGKPGLT